MNLLEGNIGISRRLMPQLAGFPSPESKAFHLPRDPAFGGVDLGAQFWDSLVATGAKLTHYRADPASLRATQDELDMAKVNRLAERIRAGNLPEQCVFISADNHIVDGHHRWAASVVAGVKDVPVSKIDLPICTIITAARAFQRQWGPLL